MPKRSGPNAGPATRDAVLDAARRLFTERGFDGTSMRDIAAEVGVTNAALYYHFPSKDARLAALSQTRRDEIDALAGWARTEGPRPGLLRETALRWLDGATRERLDSMRLAQAIRPALARAVPRTRASPAASTSWSRCSPPRATRSSGSACGWSSTPSAPRLRPPTPATISTRSRPPRG